MGTLVIKRGDTDAQLASETRTSLPSASYNGTAISGAQSFTGIKTFTCSGTYMAGNLVIGGKTCNTSGKYMPYNIKATYTKSNVKTNLANLCNGGFIKAGCGNCGNKAFFYNGDYGYNYRYKFWDAYDQSLTHTYYGTQVTSNRNYDSSETMIPMGGYLWDRPSCAACQGNTISTRRVDNSGTTTAFSSVAPDNTRINSNSAFLTIGSRMLIVGGYEYWEEEQTGQTAWNKYFFFLNGSGTVSNISSWAENKHHCIIGNAAGNDNYGFAACTEYQDALEGYFYRFDSSGTYMQLASCTTGNQNLRIGAICANNNRVFSLGGYDSSSHSFPNELKIWNVSGTYEGYSSYDSSFIAPSSSSGSYPTHNNGYPNPNFALLSSGECIFATSICGYENSITALACQSRNLSKLSSSGTKSNEANFFDVSVSRVSATTNGRHLVFAGGTHSNGSTSDPLLTYLRQEAYSMEYI